MSFHIKQAGKELFEKHLKQYAPPDPLYEYYTNDKGKKKRRKRGIPAGLSPRDAKLLKSIQLRAHYLDKSFSVLGMRFGWAFVIGLIPIVGDLTNISLNYLLVVSPARRAELPPWLLRRMHFNNALSGVVGFVPLAGDVVVAMWRANSRNAALLEEFLRVRGEEAERLAGGEPVMDAAVAGAVDAEGKRKRCVSKSDIEQVKPDSGMPSSNPTSAAGVSSSTQTRPVVETKTSCNSNKRKSFGFFGSSRKALPAPSGGESSKFVEDVPEARERSGKLGSID